MPSLGSIPHVVIAGAGPGGLAAASLLREAGAAVTVLEKHLPELAGEARRGSVVIGSEAWPILRRTGAASIIEDGFGVVGERQRMTSLRNLEQLIGAHVATQGVEVRRGVQVGQVAASATGDGVSVAVRDARTGAGEVLSADWFIDATGGHTSLSHDPRFERVETHGPHDLLPTTRTFIAARADAIGTAPVGWSAPDGSFAINDIREGVVSAYRPVDADVASDPTKARLVADSMLETLGIDAATVHGEQQLFPARQSVAAHAAEGRMLLVGDSVGMVLPVTQMGTSLALNDARRAAEAIIAAHQAPNAEAVDAIVASYDAKTVAMHRAFIR